MYKDRIKKWHLDKKTKEEEAWAMLRKKMQRSAAGKESAFRVRDKAVTIDDVLRYFKRKGILDPEAQARPQTSPTPPAVECWTPALSRDDEERDATDWLAPRCSEPQPFALGRPHIGGMLGNLSVNQTRQILFSNSDIQSFEIPSSPLPPKSLLVPERLFASITTYFHGAFDSGLFKTNDDGHLVSSTNYPKIGNHPSDFFYLCYSGVELMNLGSFAEGRRLFSQASSITNGLLQNQHPKTLQWVFDAIDYITRSGYNHIDTLLRAYIQDVAILRLAVGHPWRQVFSQLADIDTSQFEFTLDQARRCIYEIFASSLGLFHRTTIISYLVSLESQRNRLQLLRDILARTEQEIGEFDERIIDIKYRYGYNLYRDGQYAEAIEVLGEVLVQCEELGNYVYVVVDMLDAIAHSRHLLGAHEDSDEFRLREGLRALEEIAGKSDPTVLDIKIRQERRLRELGQYVNAAEVRTQIFEALGPDDIELEISLPQGV